MAKNEFELIQTFFTSHTLSRPDVMLGIGDDAALVNAPADQALVITTDTLVSGVHFAEDADAGDIGYKSLAVNLSDLAAMGAEPAWITLAITLPHANEAWLKKFAEGFFTLATQHQVQLIGGDVTRGPLSITVQAHGFVPPHQALRRDGAKPGDLIYVTHTLGDAAFALCLIRNEKFSLSSTEKKAILQRLHRPEPRIQAGKALRQIASAAIDISDGLAADLQHILDNSQVGAHVQVDHLPLSKTLSHTVSTERARAFALTGGDDYELCFTVPKEKQAMLANALKNTPHTCIGVITAKQTLDLRQENNEKYTQPTQGYQHF